MRPSLGAFKQTFDAQTNAMGEDSIFTTTTTTTTTSFKRVIIQHKRIKQIGLFVFGALACSLLARSLLHGELPNHSIRSVRESLPQRDLSHFKAPSRKTRKAEGEPPESNDGNSGLVVLAGLARDTVEIRNSTWSLLVRLSCTYNVDIHIIVKDNTVSDAWWSDLFCGPFVLDEQDSLMVGEKLSANRLLRLAQIRDAQRLRIKTLFFSSSTHQQRNRELDDAKVILLDLDLWDTPPASQIMHRINHMKGLDVICGAGIRVDESKSKMLYYDNFALVYWPDTFAFALRNRLIQHHYMGEDPSIVHTPPVKKIKGSKEMKKKNKTFSQYDMYRYLKKQAENNTLGFAPVRSCFGGLAIYQASTWLDPRCQYSLPKNLNNPESNTIFRYASKSEKFPCEHVVLHDCFHQKIFGPGQNQSRMAVDPLLVTHWKKN